MSILVTGIQGVIGRELARVMTERGIPIHPNSFTLDVCDFSYMELEGATSIIHLAAHGVVASQRNWKDCMAVNVNGGVAIVRRASSLGIPVLVARSYMEDALEAYPALRMDPYFSTKSLFYEIAQKWEGDIHFARIFQVYGRGVPGVLQYARDCFEVGREAKFGSGVGMKDWIDIRDAAEGILYACENGLTMDVGTGRLTSMRDAIETLHREMLSESKMVFDPLLDRPDTEVRIRATLASWKPKISLEKGLEGLARA